MLALRSTYAALKFCDMWQDACQVAHDPPDVHGAVCAAAGTTHYATQGILADSALADSALADSHDGLDIAVHLRCPRTL